MAVLNMDTEYNIKKALEIIGKLPKEDAFYVEFYIDNIKNTLHERNRSLKEINEALNVLKKQAW